MIYARSPYIVHVDDSGLEDIEFKLYVYQGTKDTDKGTADYEFAIDAINGEVTFDVSPYIRSVIGKRSPTGVFAYWVTMEIDKDTGSGLSGSFTSYQATDLAVMGWTTPDDGINYTSGWDGKMLSSTYTIGSGNQWLPKPLNDVAYISFTEEEQYLGTHDHVIDFYDGFNGTGSLLNSQSRTSADLDETISQVAIINSPTGAKSFVLREESDTLATETYNFWEVGDCRGDHTVILFRNKVGARDGLYFMGRAIESYETQSEKFKKSILNGNTFNSWEGQHTIYNKIGTKQIEVSSGFYPEEFNDLFQQLLFSEEVWIRSGSDHIPVIITQSSFSYKSSRYDKMINYTMTFKYAQDHLNTIS